MANDQYYAVARTLPELYKLIEVPEGYELVSCDIKLVERQYAASFTLKQSLLSKLKALKDQSRNDIRTPNISKYLLDEIIRELEKK